MKGKTKINKLWYLWLLIGIGVGVVIGKLINWKYFEISKEINLVEILNVLITTGLTWYIASILGKRLKQEQFKSDLYVAKICDIEHHLSQLLELVQDENIPYGKIISHVHVVGIAKNSLIKSLSDIYKNRGIDTINDTMTTKYKELKSLLTDRPIDKQNKSVIVKNNMITFSPDRISEIIALSYTVKEEYFKLKVLINE